jgi:transcriptional regulator with XRE-family HTH domain
MPRQADLAAKAKMQQSRISMFETPGAANLTLDTLSRLAAAFKVGLVVKFVPFSEMLEWENNYSQDFFDVTRLDHDVAFLNPNAESAQTALGGGIAQRAVASMPGGFYLTGFTAQDKAIEAFVAAGAIGEKNELQNDYAVLPPNERFLGKGSEEWIPDMRVDYPTSNPDVLLRFAHDAVKDEMQRL